MKAIDYAENWNRENPIGTRVKYWLGARDGEPSGVSKTITEAWVLSGHTAVVDIEGVSGCVAITHVKPVAEVTA